MRNCIKKDISLLVKSKLFYMSIFIIVFSGIVSLIRNSTVIGDIRQIGAINAFIFSNIIGNTITSIFSPIIITIPILAIMIDRDKNHNSSINVINIMIRTAIIASILVICAYSISYVISFIFTQNEVSMINFGYQGLFYEILKSSKFLFTIVYIFHSIICGIIFSTFSYSVYLNTTNFFFAIFMSNAIYYLSLSFKGILEGSILEISNYILPTLFYDLNHTRSIVMNLSQMLTVLIISFFLIYMSKLRIEKKNLSMKRRFI